MITRQKLQRLSGLASIFALAAIAALTAVFPTPASTGHLAFAAQPSNQACLGHDLSGYAQGGSLFGDFINGLASGTQGIGNEIQLHLGGLVPDTVIPNSCND
jgi:hypothetical protein